MPKSIRYRVFENPDSASAQIVAEIAHLVRERATLGRNAVLGLPTGQTPLPLYDELIYQHREEGLSLKNVITFNLDEYLGLSPTHPASFRSYMQEHLFDHVDIPEKNIRFLSGSVAEEEVASHCAAYEKQINAAGGIDFQILGIGSNGHIAFNEPGTAVNSRTRRVGLGATVREDAAETFEGLENVPMEALTMGCETILKARKIALLAWGSKKARIVRRALQGPVTPRVCASYLQNHPNTQFFLDPMAASVLRKK